MNAAHASRSCSRRAISYLDVRHSLSPNRRSSSARISVSRYATKPTRHALLVARARVQRSRIRLRNHVMFSSASASRLSRSSCCSASMMFSRRSKIELSRRRREGQGRRGRYVPPGVADKSPDADPRAEISARECYKSHPTSSTVWGRRGVLLHFALFKERHYGRRPEMASAISRLDRRQSRSVFFFS